MAEQERLEAILSELNGALGDVTPYKLAVVNPRDVQHVDKNAHYMPTKVYRQLVDNVKKDGNLSSLPFCWRKTDGTFVALSGNHRIDAARDAGVPLLLVLYTDAKLTRAQQVGIQLSHNAIFGQDNPQVLRELWTEIDDLTFKVYSGLDELMLDAMEKANVIRITEAPLRFEELTLLFIPSEIDRIEETVYLAGQVQPAALGGPTGRLRPLLRCTLELQGGGEHRKHWNCASGDHRDCRGVAGGTSRGGTWERRSGKRLTQQNAS